jgi:hypothetical protein
LERRLSLLLRDIIRIGVDTVSSFHTLLNGEETLLSARVESVDWFPRPICVGKDYARGALRRSGGVNVTSDWAARRRMVLDAMEGKNGRSDQCCRASGRKPGHVE